MKNYIFKKLINSNINFRTRLRFLNCLLKIFNWPVKLQENDGILLVDGTFALNISRLERLYIYRRGISLRFTKYVEDYHINYIKISDGCNIVDIVANIGELFVILSQDRKINYFGIEPDPREFKALLKNAPSGTLSNCALFSTSASMKFYSSNETGDSSLIQNTNNPTITVVSTIKLSDFIDEKIEGPIKLIKLEAEGCEYEILSVLEDRHFSRIEFISADLGCERGLDNESTLKPVVNLLLKRNFEIVAFNPSRLTLLFVNLNFVH